MGGERVYDFIQTKGISDREQHEEKEEKFPHVEKSPGVFQKQKEFVLKNDDGKQLASSLVEKEPTNQGRIGSSVSEVNFPQKMFVPKRNDDIQPASLMTESVSANNGHTDPSVQPLSLQPMAQQNSPNAFPMNQEQMAQMFQKMMTTMAAFQSQTKRSVEDSENIEHNAKRKRDFSD